VIRRYETELRNEVNKRRRAEEALRESEERYQLAVRGANDGLWEELKTNEV
jgi:PAS domain-containing protein